MTESCGEAGSVMTAGYIGGGEPCQYTGSGRYQEKNNDHEGQRMNGNCVKTWRTYIRRSPARHKKLPHITFVVVPAMELGGSIDIAVQTHMVWPKQSSRGAKHG